MGNDVSASREVTYTDKWRVCRSIRETGLFEPPQCHELTSQRSTTLEAAAPTAEEAKAALALVLEGFCSKKDVSNCQTIGDVEVKEVKSFWTTLLERFQFQLPKGYIAHWR